MELDSLGFIGIQLIKKLIKKNNSYKTELFRTWMSFFSILSKIFVMCLCLLCLLISKISTINIGSHDDIREDRMAWEKGFDPVFRRVRISVGTVSILWNHCGWLPLELACSVRIVYIWYVTSTFTGIFEFG